MHKRNDDQRLSLQFFTEDGVWICLYDADLGQIQVMESQAGDVTFTAAMQGIVIDWVIDRGPIGDYVKVGMKDLQSGFEWSQWVLSLLEESSTRCDADMPGMNEMTQGLARQSLCHFIHDSRFVIWIR